MLWQVGRHLVPEREATNGESAGWLGGFHNGVTYDYSAEGFEQQLDASLQRMGLGYIDSLVIHDLEPSFHKTPEDDGAQCARLFGASAW